VHIQRDPKRKAGRRISGMVAVLGVDADGRWLLEPIA
jgi:hypothetical protein